MLHWSLIVRRIIKLIDPQREAYLSGGQFIRMVQEVDPDLPGYSEFIEDRNRKNRSTTRRDFFRDTAIRASLAGATASPNAEIPVEFWAGERLNRYLQDIDDAITLGDFSLQYALLELH
jgi:hypothetical protein